MHGVTYPVEGRSNRGSRIGLTAMSTPVESTSFEKCLSSPSACLFHRNVSIRGSNRPSAEVTVPLVQRYVSPSQ
ncbi:hypothetical protein V3C99_005868 [Haemonchus contortus]